MKLFDISVPLDAALPTCPGNTPFSLAAIKRIARGDSSNASPLHVRAHGGTRVDAPRRFFDDGVDALALDLRDVEPGDYDTYCLPLRPVGSDGAPARVALGRN